MRKFGIKYTALHPQHLLVREAFTRIRTKAEWDAVFARWYSEDRPGVHPSPEIHASHQECA
jgi:hypothetical protein